MHVSCRGLRAKRLLSFPLLEQIFTKHDFWASVKCCRATILGASGFHNLSSEAHNVRGKRDREASRAGLEPSLQLPLNESLEPSGLQLSAPWAQCRGNSIYPGVFS